MTQSLGVPPWLYISDCPSISGSKVRDLEVWKRVVSSESKKLIRIRTIKGVRVTGLDQIFWRETSEYTHNFFVYSLGHKVAAWVRVFRFVITTVATLQTSQNFLIQKMFQKNLRICPILPPFFDPKNWMKIWNLFKISQVKKILRKAQVFSWFFDSWGFTGLHSLLQFTTSKNAQETYAFLNIFLSWNFLNGSHIFLHFQDQKMLA